MDSSYLPATRRLPRSAVLFATLAWLSCALTARAGGPPTPPEVGPNDFRISFAGGTGTTEGNGFDSAIAYDSDLDRYLVVFDGADPNFAIRGQMVATDGSLLGGPFEIADGSHDHPAVAYNPTEQRFLVVWQESSFGDVEGQMLDAAGAPFGPRFQLDEDVGATPALTYTPSVNAFFVVWTADNFFTGLDEVLGHRVDGVTGLPLELEPLVIAESDSNVTKPAVAHNPSADELLVVWQGTESAGPAAWEAYGRRVRVSDGAALGPGQFRISDMGIDGDAYFDALDPDVAYNPRSDEYLVVWWGDDHLFPVVEGEHEIWAQRLSSNGTEIGPNDFRISDVGGLRETTFEAELPRIAVDPSSGLYLVTWVGDDDVGGLVESEGEIFGQILTAAGMEVGPNDFRLSDLGGTGDDAYDAHLPATAWGGGEMMVVWHGDDHEDGLIEGEIEVFGQRLDLGFFIFGDGFESGDTSPWVTAGP